MITPLWRENGQNVKNGSKGSVFFRKTSSGKRNGNAKFCWKWTHLNHFFCLKKNSFIFRNYPLRVIYWEDCIEIYRLKEERGLGEKHRIIRHFNHKRNAFYIFEEGRNRNKTIKRSNMQDSKTNTLSFISNFEQKEKKGSIKLKYREQTNSYCPNTSIKITSELARNDE